MVRTPQQSAADGKLPVSTNRQKLAHAAATRNGNVATSRTADSGNRVTVDAGVHANLNANDTSNVTAHGDGGERAAKRERVERVLQIVGSLVRTARQQSAHAGIDNFADAGDYDLSVDAYYPEEAYVGESCAATDLAAAGQYSVGYEDTEYVETSDPSVAAPVAASVDAFSETANEVDGDQPGVESAEGMDGPEVPIGSTLTLTLELPEVEGVILLKTGPLVIRLFPATWTTESTELTLPDFHLMRNAAAEIYVLEQGGQLISSQALTLVPAAAKTAAE